MGIRKRDPEGQVTERVLGEAAMRRGGREPCEECVERCRMVHGRNNRGDPSAQRVPCFFKIMLSDDIHSLMFIPRNFARTIMSLAEQRVQLEDSNGNCWTVKISLVGGRLAFKRGWRKFFVDHSIEIGDLLLFHYHIGSRFMVKIFDKSACERLNFSDKSGVDEGALLEVGEVHLPSSVLDLTPIEAPLPMNDEVSVEKEGSCSGVNSLSNHNQDAEGVFVSKNEALDSDKTNSRPHIASSQGCAEVPFYMINRNEVHEEMTRSSLFDLSNMEMAGCNNAVEGPQVVKNEQSSHSNVNLIQSNTTLKETIGKRKTCGGASPDVTVVKVPRKKCASEDAEKAQSKTICELGTAYPLAQIESTLDHGKAVMQNPGISYEGTRGASFDASVVKVLKCSAEDADKVQSKSTGEHGTASSLALTESALDHEKAAMQNQEMSKEATRGASPDVCSVVEAPRRKCTSEDAVQSKATCEHGTASPLAQIESTLNHGKAVMQNLEISDEAGGASSNVSMVKVSRRKSSYLDVDKIQLNTTCKVDTASPLAQIDSTQDHEKSALQKLKISNEATRAASPDVSVLKASRRKFTSGIAGRLRSKTTREHGAALPLSQIESTLAHGKSVMQNLGISNEARRRASPDVSVVKMPMRKCTSEDADEVPSKTSCEHGAASPLSQVELTPDHGKDAMQNPGNPNEAARGCSLWKEGRLADSGTIFTEAVPQTKNDVHGTSSGSIQQSTTKLLPEKLDFIIEGEKLVAPKLEQEEMDYPLVEVERKMTEDVKAEAIDFVDFYCSVSVVTQSYLELPKMVLPISCKGRAESRFLLLLDPASRVWPVIYQEKRGHKVFTTGWEALAKANNIHQGDKCVISAKNESEGLFKVHIVGRKTE